MKKLYLVATFILFASFVQAQVPQKLSYQAVLRSSANVLLSNRPVGLRISVLKDSATGTVVYSEMHESSTNNNGLINIKIGAGNAILGTFKAIDWSAGNYYVKTETDPDGGNNYSIVGTSELLSVPYALYAGNGGTPGPKGDKGDKGDTGATGLQGIQGLKGDKGDQGIQGLKGDKGDVGATGTQGIQGIKGDKGDQGIQGLKGDKGDVGATGVQGIQGIKGDKGDQGIQGLKGDKGDTGATGLQGIQGLKGDKGDQGIQGLKGDKGDVGATGAQGISVKSAGVVNDSLKITLSNSTTITTGYVKGAKGDSGISVRATNVVGDSLYVKLSTGQTLNAGHVRGVQGVSVDSIKSINDSVYFYKSNGSVNGVAMAVPTGVRIGFDTSTIWTCPAGVTKITVECWGGAGGGGGGSTFGTGYYGGSFQGGDGGSGGYNSGIINVIPGKKYFITIGKGGKGGSSGYTPTYTANNLAQKGSDGEATSFNDQIVAQAGTGGSAGVIDLSKVGTGNGNYSFAINGIDGLVVNYPASIYKINFSRTFINNSIFQPSLPQKCCSKKGSRGVLSLTYKPIREGSDGSDGENGFVLIIY